MITFKEGENIILEVRKHWFILLTETFFLLVMLVIPFFLYFIGGIEYVSGFFERFALGQVYYLYVLCSFLWLLFLWNSFFLIWTDYFLDILIVTNKRIIDIEQKGLFSREVSTMRIDRVQDVTSEIHGIIPTFLHFGHVHIQTAGENREIIAKNIPNPQDVRDAITEAQNASLETKERGL